MKSPRIPQIAPWKHESIHLYPFYEFFLFFDATWIRFSTPTIIITTKHECYMNILYLTETHGIYLIKRDGEDHHDIPKIVFYFGFYSLLKHNATATLSCTN